MTPDYHPRPTGPGLWVCFPDRRGRIRQIIVLDLDDEDLVRGAPFETVRVYGPIPPYVDPMEPDYA